MEERQSYTVARLPEMEAPTNGAPATTSKSLAIDLETVFRLAEDQNAKVSLARARVREAVAENDLAAVSWLPRFDIGTAYYRHEGGIANENGTLTHSSFGTFFGVTRRTR